MAYLRSNNSQLKQQLMKNSTLLRQGSPSIHQIHTQDTSISGDIRKCQLGTAKYGSTDKVIMMVGATGSGKTTMIDAMFNYVVGVELKDQFRFKLVDESEQAQTSTQAESQTNGITAYTLHHQDGFAVPYTLTIVDTPGFDDIRGKEHNKKLTKQMMMFFTTAGDAGIDHIDAVVFVMIATDGRLTENQKYIYNSVLSLWGKDIEGNIFIFFSFADNKKPAAFAALESANIPHRKETCFKFNNSTLFGDDESDDEDDDEFAAIYWKMNAKSFDGFLIEHLVKVECKALTLSRAVPELRNMLEKCQEKKKEKLQNMVNKQEQIKEQNELLKKHRTDLDKNKNFTYTETIQENVKEQFDYIIRRAINCSECERTCHYPCMAIWTPYTCSIFKWGGQCTVCFCSFRKHSIEDFTYKRETKIITKTNEDLKKQNLDAQGKAMSVSEMVEEAAKQLKSIEKKFFDILMVQKLIIETLQEIALQSTSQSTDQAAGWKERDYIKQMIETEEKEGKEGWRERKQLLEDVLEKSEELSCDTEFMPIVQDYKEDPNLSREDDKKCKILQKIVRIRELTLKYK